MGNTKNFVSGCVYFKFARGPRYIHRKAFHIAFHFQFQGIGDSGQGFTNAILFILFTKNARDSFISCICCKCRKTVPTTSGSEVSSPSSAHKMTHEKDMGSGYTARYGSMEVNTALFKSLAAGDTIVA